MELNDFNFSNELGGGRLCLINFTSSPKTKNNGGVNIEEETKSELSP